jgi:predicted transcriptional regulator
VGDMNALPLRLPDDLSERLREASADEGISMNNLVVVAIAEYLERRDLSHVLGLARETAADHADVLDRLA